MYGSELAGIQRSNLGGHLVGREVAGHVAVEDGLGGVGWLKSLEANGGNRTRHASSSLDTFMFSDWLAAPGHESGPYNILPWGLGGYVSPFHLPPLIGPVSVDGGWPRTQLRSYQQAVATDPNYAAAYAGMSTVAALAAIFPNLTAAAAEGGAAVSLENWRAPGLLN